MFQQANYLENFVQATFDALPAESLTGKRSARTCSAVLGAGACMLSSRR